MIHEWQAGEVFVFGSNREGLHVGGAALFAATHCGARSGIGEGLTGQSYALPTCSAPGVPLDLAEVAFHVGRFLSVAAGSPEFRFFLTRVGCGIAGFTDAEIAPLFRGLPPNVRTPPEWAPYLESR